MSQESWSRENKNNSVKYAELNEAQLVSSFSEQQHYSFGVNEMTELVQGKQKITKTREACIKSSVSVGAASVLLLFSSVVYNTEERN